MAAFVLLLIALFCMSLSSEDSKNDKPATTPSYSHTTDSDDSADNNKPSTPSFEKVNTNSLKNRSVKEVTSELDGKSLSYKFLVDGGDGSDQTATVKTAVQNGEEWTVTEANQSMTDGEVTLTVREKEPAQQQKPQQADSNGIITAANNPEFAALLGVKDPFDSSVAAFAENTRDALLNSTATLQALYPTISIHVTCLTIRWYTQVITARKALMDQVSDSKESLGAISTTVRSAFPPSGARPLRKTMSRRSLRTAPPGLRSACRRGLKTR